MLLFLFLYLLVKETTWKQQKERVNSIWHVVVVAASKAIKHKLPYLFLYLKILPFFLSSLLRGGFCKKIKASI
jgi:hypothetical protein